MSGNGNGDSGAKLKVPVVLAPSGKFVSIPYDLFNAIVDFCESKHTGSVQIQFRDGGIAGVEAMYKRTYARGKQDGT